MDETKERIEKIQGFINTNIEIINGKGISEQEKEISYMLIQENIDTLIKLHSESVDLGQKEYIKKKIIVVKRKLFNYLAQVNNWDKRIFDQYIRIVDFY